MESFDPQQFMRLVQTIVLYAIPILFAVTVHEASHGWVASLCGDKTALMMGRLTLNPIKHIDLMGTIIVPALCLMFGNFIFGWAKPVPVNWLNLRNPRRDSALVALAGPAANLFMALCWAFIALIGKFLFEKGTFSIMYLMGQVGVMINLMLMVLNLFPIPPLDGSRVVSSLLPRDLAVAYDRLEPYGFFILILLIVTNVLSVLLIPPIEFLKKIIFSIFSL